MQRHVERASLVVVVVASVWFALAVSWGLFGRIAAGHDAVVAARGIIAENMLSWHIGGPVREYTLERPGPSLYYAHHPWGTFWSITAFAAMLGRHAYVPRLFAVVASAMTPPLLYGVGRALWGPVAGALAALAYATLPITLAFGNFPGFEVPLVASCLLTTWGYVRFARERRYRWMAVSLVGALLCANTDWEAEIFLAVAVAGSTAIALFGRRRRLGQLEALALGRWSWLTALIGIGTISAYAYYFQHIGAIGDLTAQLTARTRGNSDRLSDVLKARSYWIDVTFTPLAIAVGKIALPLFLLRILLLRRALEIFPIAIFVMAVVQYVKFKNGADVHIYWPLPFAPYYALSVGVIAESAGGIARRILAIRGHATCADAAPAASLAVFSLVPLATLPDGIEALHYARMTGGRFNEKGKLALREEDKSQALEWMAQRMEGRATVDLHDGMRPTWAQAWALHRPIRQATAIPVSHTNGQDRYFIGDLAFMTASDQLRLAHEFSLIAVGQYVFVDRAIAPPAPVEGLVFDPREPNPLEWYFLSGVDPIRTVRADAFYTWELRDHYGQTPNPSPDGPPASLEQLRIAHNAAVAANDSGLAERYQHEFMASIDARVARTYSTGTKLLGERYTSGVAPTLALYFLAVGQADADYQFDVISVVDDRRFLSLVPPDDKIKSVGVPFVIPPRLWRKGYIYVSYIEIRHRPGREMFFGSFSGPPGFLPPKPVDETSGAPLLILR
jgi:4-amino-4-deoxy-L-arabinose transferase-like glycosyltransferase